jgi:hypothetical protein
METMENYETKKQYCINNISGIVGYTSAILKIIRINLTHTSPMFLEKSREDNIQRIDEALEIMEKWWNLRYEQEFSITTLEKFLEESSKIEK